MSSAKFYGLNDLDAKVANFVDFDNGFYFEAGANNGIWQSNSLYFEESRGWRGILVEPIPHRFFECVVNRPKAFVEWGALVPAGWNKADVELTYCNLMTVTKGSWPSIEAETMHVERGKIYMPEEKTFDFRARPLTISALLDKHRVSHVDFMSIDLEGFEIQALKGLDFSRHRPTWLLVEERKPLELLSFLSPWYALAEKLSHHDYLFRRKD
jgi:FkbM family methyltransferase